MADKVNDIDIVIYWVDGSDEKWLSKKASYQPARNTDMAPGRYRDTETLRYLFRGIEKNMPWVRNVFFISDEQIPSWLNTDAPKLKIVDHKDYIPSEYLPVFSSHPIELNFHRIKELSEQFIVMNDDFLVVNETKPEDFFVDGKPRDIFMEYPIMCGGKTPVFSSILANTYNLIGRHFDRKEYKKRLKSKIITLKYGKYCFYNLMMYMLPFPKFFGLLTPHFARPYLKSVFDEVWAAEGEALDKVCHNRFRSNEDINIYAMRMWNLMKGNFVPGNIHKDGKTYLLTDLDDTRKAASEIRLNKQKLICINDDLKDEDFDEAKKIFLEALDSILPGRSVFEKEEA